MKRHEKLYRIMWTWPYILDLIDHATRFSTGAIISTKWKEVIIDKIFKQWIALFGTLKLFLSGNGGVFNNDIFHEMDEQLSINGEN